MSTTDTSRWHPLEKNQIRLLILQPAQVGPISCDLRITSLEDGPAYEALSYCWGTTYYEPGITLCGAPYPVTSNLHAALNILRHGTRPRTLWVDAVCINQLDLAERASQVALMGLVYRQAVSVPVWLGDQDSTLLAAALEYDLYIEHDKAFEYGKDSNPHSHFDTVPEILLNCLEGWWSRSWTLQECILARDVVLLAGEYTCSIEQFQGYSDAVRRHLFAGRTCCKADVANRRAQAIGPITVMLGYLVRVRKTRDEISYSLLDLMVEYSSRYATDGRDKIFAFAGFAQSIPEGLITYELPLKECLIHASALIMAEMDSLELLCYSNMEPRRDRLTMPAARVIGLPSWCADWSQSMDASSLLLVNRYRGTRRQFYTAAGDTSADVNIHNGRYLGVSAIIYDAIRAVGDYGHHVPESFNESSKNWYALVADNLRDCHATCDGCERAIHGVRHKCQVCVDFDYCALCIRKASTTHPDHRFTELRQDKDKAGEPTSWEGHSAQGAASGSDDPTFGWTLLDTEYCFHPDESLQDAFRRTMMGNKLDPWWDGENSNFAPDSRLLFEELTFALFWSRHVEQRPFTGPIPTNNAYTALRTPEVLEHFTDTHVGLLYTQIQSITFKKRMAITERGHIGLVPGSARPGDKICVLRGGDVPFVLRPVGVPVPDDEDSCVSEEDQEVDVGVPGAGQYTLVGDCYVHGIMKGEIMGLLEEGSLEEDYVVLH